MVYTKLRKQNQMWLIQEKIMTSNRNDAKMALKMSRQGF